MMFDIIGKRFWFFLISGVLILISIISLATVGLKPGIEFSSGSMLTVRFETAGRLYPVSTGNSQAGLSLTLLFNAPAQGEFLIRTQELTEEEKTQIEAALTAQFGKLSESQFYSVSPLVATETARNAAIAVVVAMVGILLYVTWAFRHMPNPFRYGTCAIIALFHDALVTVGIFSLLRWHTGLGD